MSIGATGTTLFPDLSFDAKRGIAGHPCRRADGAMDKARVVDDSDGAACGKGCNLGTR